MKTTNTLKTYLQKRLNLIDSLLKKPKRSFTVNDFHYLRVELKKLRAFFKLVNFCCRNFKKKQVFKPFKAIFKQAGKIRELQLEELALKKHLPYHSLSVYITNLKRQLVKERTAYFYEINKKDKLRIKKTGSQLLKYIPKIKVKTVNEFIEKERKEIKRLLYKKRLSVHHIHALRKLLKEFYYNNKSLNMPERKNRLTQLHDLQELIGKWHDAHVMATHLKKAATAEKTVLTEVIDLKEIKKRYLLTRKMLLHKINRSKQKLILNSY